MAFFGAQQRHRLFSPAGYNIPKPKFLFYVNFVCRHLDAQFLNLTNFVIKSMDRPTITYDVVELNQYNKKRLAQTKIHYGPLGFTFYDTIDGYAAKLIEAYNKFYYGDFSGKKNNNSWNYDITTNNYDDTISWGLKSDIAAPNASYFFDRIEFYEFYDQRYSQVNYINPKFVNVDFDRVDHESSEGNTVSISCEYEGIVVEHINDFITPQLADKFGVSFAADFGLPLGAYLIPGVANILSPGLDFLTNAFSNFGLGELIPRDLGINTLSRAVQTGNGSVIFDQISRNAIGLTGRAVPNIRGIFI